MNLRSQNGFTLAEILLGLAVVMILAGVAVVSFTGLEEDAMETALIQSLQRVRTGVDYFMFQHQESTPGYDGGTASWTASAFENQLTQATDGDGDWAAPGTAGYAYGPYLLEGMPTNPFNELDTVLMIPPAGAFGGPDNTTGWVYFASTGFFRANSSGNAPSGTPFYDL